MDQGQIDRLERLQALRDRGALTDAEFAASKLEVMGGGAAPTLAIPRPPLIGNVPFESRDALRARGLHFKHYPVWLMVTFSVLTLGVYAQFWLNHWHGIMPKRRIDDPSTGRAIGFLFIPLFNLYWLFESQLRLCTRLDEEFSEAGLPDRVPRELVRWTCIFTVVPYLNFIVAPILATIATGIMQSRVNRLAEVDRAWYASTAVTQQYR